MYMHRPHSGPVESKSPGLGLGHLCFYKVPREFSQASRVESQSDDGAGSHPLHGTLAVALQGHQSPCVGCLLLYYALSSQIGNTEQKNSEADSLAPAFTPSLFPSSPHSLGLGAAA